MVLRVGFGLGVSDTHGMKALDRARVLPLAEACRSDGELFDTELILRAERAGLGVAELPVTVAERRTSRTSITRRALRTLAGLARLRLTLARDRRVPTMTTVLAGALCRPGPPRPGWVAAGGQKQPRLADFERRPALADSRATAPGVTIDHLPRLHLAPLMVLWNGRSKCSINSRCKSVAVAQKAGR